MIYHCVSSIVHKLFLETFLKPQDLFKIIMQKSFLLRYSMFLMHVIPFIEVAELIPFALIKLPTGLKIQVSELGPSCPSCF